MSVRVPPEVTHSTSSAVDSPHTSKHRSSRVQLRSPFAEATQYFKELNEQRRLSGLDTSLNSTMNDDSMMVDSHCIAASSTPATAAAATATCPSLPMPFPHRPAVQSRNIIHALNARQARSYGVSRMVFKHRTHAHQFGRLELRRTATTFDSTTTRQELDLLTVQKKSKIMEIVSAGNFVFALTHAGICVAFDSRQEKHRTDDTARCCSCALLTSFLFGSSHLGSLKRLCYLNIINDEVIRSLFYNKVNQSLITVSVYRHDSFTSLRCRSTPFEAIAAGKPELGISLFASESLQWPGFVEFDDVNKKVLTFSALTKKYKIWDLMNYSLIYDMMDPNIDEVKISPGIMLLIMKRGVTSCPLRIISIETGETLLSWSTPLVKAASLQFIEQFNEKLLVKQRKCSLIMTDVHDPKKSREIPRAEFATPSAFIFLYENQLFLTFIKREIAVWNLNGQQVARFEDHFNWWPDCNTNNIFINTAQDIIISYCLTPQQAEAMQNRNTNALEWKRLKQRTGSINISDIFTGKCIAKIEKRKQLKYPFHLLSPAQQQHAISDYKRNFGKSRLGRVIQPCGPEAMIDVLTGATAGGSDPAARAIELQQEERSLQMLLHLNAQEQQQLQQISPHSPLRPAASNAAASASNAPSTPAHNNGGTMSSFYMEAASMMVDGDDEDDDDEVDDEDSEGSRDDQPNGSDHSEDEDREEKEIERLEAEGIVTADRVLFPLQTPPAPTPVPPHHLPPIEPDLPDLAAYRAYNRAVRARNAALKEITAVCYNEERNEIYTGNRAGKIHVWSH